MAGNVEMEALTDLNFRDLGGIEVAGGRVRHGFVYRSEGPASFSAVQDAALTSLGIRLVCDLRSAAEYQREAARPAWGARTVQYDIAADFRSGTGPNWKDLGADVTAEVASDSMRSTYAAMPAALAPHLGGLVGAMVAGELPLLIHCTAGKDRTGVLVALLLAILGAEREAIVMDYRRSIRFGERSGNRERVKSQLAAILGSDVDGDVLNAAAGVDRSYIDAALDAVTAQYRSFEAYFAEARIEGLTVSALRRILVEPCA